MNGCAVFSLHHAVYIKRYIMNGKRNRQGLLIVACILMGMMNAQADETLWQKTTATYKATWASKYMWRGLDLQDDEPAIQSDLFVDIGATGFYAGAFYSAAADARDKWRSWDEVDGYLGYYSTVWAEKKYVVEYDFGFTHYYFFNKENRDADTQDVALILKMPKAFPLGSSFFVPRLKLCYGWSPFADVDSGLWIGVTGLYDYPLPRALGLQEGQKLSFKVESYHNDGGQSYNLTPGWGHVLAGCATTMTYKGIRFTPETYYQWSLEKTVDYEDEWWFLLSLGLDLK